MLFTSPEDMIIGHSVTLQHRKEVTSASAARKLRTVNKLVSSTMDYEPTKVLYVFLFLSKFFSRPVIMI